MGMIHHLMTDGSILSMKSSKLPTREELRRMVGGDIERVRIFPGKRIAYMYVNEIGALEPRLPFNLWGTLLYHEGEKYRRGLKSVGDSGGEQPIDCLEALAFCEPLGDCDKIYGNAVWLDGDDLRKEAEGGLLWSNQK